MFIKARYEETVGWLQPQMSQASSLAIVVMLVTILVLQFSAIIGTIGIGGILAALLFLVGALLIGLQLGGTEASMRSVMGLGTAQPKPGTRPGLRPPPLVKTRKCVQGSL